MVSIRPGALWGLNWLSSANHFSSSRSSSYMPWGNHKYTLLALHVPSQPFDEQLVKPAALSVTPVPPRFWANLN